jgi:hypothetical protein
MRQLEIVYKSEAARVYWNGEATAVEFEALCCTKGDRLRSAFERTIALIEKRRACKLLVRVPEMDEIEAECFLRACTPWMPRLFEEGVKYLVIVTPGPADLLEVGVEETRCGLDEVTGELSKGPSDSVESAREWLRGH